VQVYPDKIGTQSGNLEFDLTQAMCGIDNDIDPACLCESRNLTHRHLEPGPVANMRQQNQFDTGVGFKRLSIGVDDILIVGRFGQRNLDRPSTAPGHARLKASLHTVIIEISIERRLPGLDPIIAANQRLQRFRGISSKDNFLGFYAKEGGEPRMRCAPIRSHSAPGIEAAFPVNLRNTLLIGSENRAGHHAPVPVFQLDHFICHVILAGNLRPISLIAGQSRSVDRGGSRGSPQGSRREHRRAHHCAL